MNVENSFEITSTGLNEIIEKSTFIASGDDIEKQYGYLLDGFENCENLWKYFIVPFTERINASEADTGNKIRVRAGVDEKLQEIASFHYAVFLNLVYAQTVLNNPQLSSFENFYTHLGSVCDAVEEFLLRIYLLQIECRQSESKVLQKLSKSGFLSLAVKWYDDNYSSIYELYLNKGKKPPPIDLPGRTHLLDEYFFNNDSWTQYKKFSQLIKQYRNVIVHNYQIAFIQNPQTGEHWVPKKEKIGNYKKWNAVFKVSDKAFERDFIKREDQMIYDINHFKKLLNNLWVKPIADLKQLLYTDKNTILLKKYNLTILES